MRAALGLAPRPAGVRRPLLTSIHAPLLAAVVEAHGLPDAPTQEWTVDGTTVSTEEAALAHRAWYAARPEMLAAARERAEPVAALLGLP